MKRGKKFLAALTTCSMMAGMPAVMPVNAENTYENLTYSVVGEQYIAIMDCSDLAMSVEIPAEIEGLPVQQIANDAFSSCTILSKVVIPETVTTIGRSAFSDCAALKEIDFPENLTYIGEYAFSSSGLTSIIIPDSVTSIGESAFGWCHSLESISIGNGLTQIGYVFNGCDSLAEVIIPTNIETLGGAFYGCTSLKTVTFEEGSKLHTINSTFTGCSGLESITLPETVTQIFYGFKGCTSLKNIAIPDSVTEMYAAFSGDYLFPACTSLETVTFGTGSKLESLSSDFKDCINLKEIVLPKTVTSMDVYTFENCDGLEKITFLNSYTDIPNDAVSIPETAVIHCYENSTAHAYALVQGREYVLMEEPVLPLGDLDADESVTASDAAALLTAAAAAGAGGESGLTAEQEAAADVNADGKFDASDAAIVLQYAAYVGTGGTQTLEEFITSQN